MQQREKEELNVHTESLWRIFDDKKYANVLYDPLDKVMFNTINMLTRERSCISMNLFWCMFFPNKQWLVAYLLNILCFNKFKKKLFQLMNVHVGYNA